MTTAESVDDAASTSQDKRLPVLWFILSIALLVCAWLGVTLVLHHFGQDTQDSQNWSIRGQIGDSFGAVNSLFSGLAFLGLFWSLYFQQQQLTMQRDELRLQRQELRLQREEMSASRSELKNQVAAQQALYRATVAQITVASCQMRIDAAKNNINGVPSTTCINIINKQAADLDALAAELNVAAKVWEAPRESS